MYACSRARPRAAKFFTSVWSPFAALSRCEDSRGNEWMAVLLVAWLLFWIMGRDDWAGDRPAQRVTGTGVVPFQASERGLPPRARRRSARDERV